MQGRSLSYMKSSALYGAIRRDENLVSLVDLSRLINAYKPSSGFGGFTDEQRAARTYLSIILNPSRTLQFFIWMNESPKDSVSAEAISISSIITILAQAGQTVPNDVIHPLVQKFCDDNDVVNSEVAHGQQGFLASHKYK